jgi:hypothetical protein
VVGEDAVGIGAEVSWKPRIAYFDCVARYSDNATLIYPYQHDAGLEFSYYVHSRQLKLSY